MGKIEHTATVLARLREVIPEPETELEYQSPFELLVAVLLSAQCTDERINKVTPALFAAFPDARALSKAEPEDVLPYIRSVSYPNNKSKALARLGTELCERFGGRVPDNIKDLESLPGVGHKTAQVVVSVAFGVPAFPVDTHVFRVANRLGLTEKAHTVSKVEAQLKRRIPEAQWGTAHHLLILHGRYTCKAQKPDCDACNCTDICPYFAALKKLPKPLSGLAKDLGSLYCGSCNLYFDEAAEHEDRQRQIQIACPRCSSMRVFETRTGKTTKKARDYRV